MIIHAGDLVSARFLGELRGLGPPVEAVRGNVDAPELQVRLPATLTLTFEGVVLGVIHDGGPSKGRVRRLQRQFPTADAVIFGHSHLPVHQFDGAFQIFNPGSPTQRRRAPHHTMGLAQIACGAVDFELVMLDGLPT